MCLAIVALDVSFGQLSHGDSHQSGSFCAQSAASQGDGLITLADGFPHLLNREVAFRTDEYGHILLLWRLL